MDWDQFDLNPKVVAALKKADIKSIKEVLNLSGADLQRLLKLSGADVECLLKTVSRALRKSCVLTALQLYQDKDPFSSQRQKLSLGCSVLDDLLKGGIPLVGITELAGESSAGKTQIGLQLCLCVQYPYRYGGLESGAVYICTEDAFPSKRLQQLMAQQHKLRADVPPEVIQKIRFGNNIFVEHAADLDTFHNCITKRISVLLARGAVRLVVIDSIAALFRCEFGASDSVLRARYLQTFGAQLHGLSSRFRAPIMCINQVTDAVSDAEAAQCGCRIAGIFCLLGQNVDCLCSLRKEVPEPSDIELLTRFKHTITVQVLLSALDKQGAILLCFGGAILLQLCCNRSQVLLLAESVQRSE